MTLEIGGSQINAIDLAGAVRDRGHSVAVFGVKGPLVQQINDLGLSLIESPPFRRRPSPAVMRALRDIVERERIQLVHGYERWACHEAYLGGQILGKASSIFSILDMAIPADLPRRPTLIVGTRKFQDETAAGRSGRTVVIEPSVDLVHDQCSGNLGSAFRQQHGLEDRHITVVIVSRLSVELKLEGVLTAIRAISMLDATLLVRLVIVGDGPAFSRVAAEARAANSLLGRSAILVIGSMVDPRPAYAAADIVLGMGGSSLRAMAFRKPVIILGEGGYVETLTPRTAEQFLWHGLYGIASGTDGCGRLASELTLLASSAERREQLGAFGKRFVADHFSLTSLAARLEDVYASSLSSGMPARDALVDTARLLKDLAAEKSRVHRLLRGK